MIESASQPMRAIVVGAGNMGREWLREIQAYDDTELVGLVDLDIPTAQQSLVATHSPMVPISKTLEDAISSVQADFVVDVTTPEAHHRVTMTALEHGLHVLGEKPLAHTLPESLELIATSETYDRLFMVSQNRRYDQQLLQFRSEIGRLGRLGMLVATFFKAPRFGGFRDVMDHPLLLDMAIHAFDAARFLTASEPVAIFCDEYNPPWSWYAGDAAANVLVEMTGGVRFIYNGSWCSPGSETSWNASWRASGEYGASVWDGVVPPATEIDGVGAIVPRGHGTTSDEHAGIAGALREFVAAVRDGRTPMGECHENVMSLAMVHAAVASASRGERIRVADVLGQAHEEALARASGPTKITLASWDASSVGGLVDRPGSHG